MQKVHLVGLFTLLPQDYMKDLVCVQGTDRETQSVGRVFGAVDDSPKVTDTLFNNGMCV